MSNYIDLKRFPLLEQIYKLSGSGFPTTEKTNHQDNKFTKLIQKTQVGGSLVDLDLGTKYVPVQDQDLDTPEIQAAPAMKKFEYSIPSDYDAYTNSTEGVSSLDTIQQLLNTYSGNQDTQKPSSEYAPAKSYKGLPQFNKYYDEVEKEDPSAKDYRKILTKLAEVESSFNSGSKNQKGAPAYGYFQMMQGHWGKQNYNNIAAYAGSSIGEFINNPKVQIKAALKMIKELRRSLPQAYIESARQQGYNINGLLGAAWLGGIGGLDDYFKKDYSRSDGHDNVKHRLKETSV